MKALKKMLRRILPESEREKYIINLNKSKMEEQNKIEYGKTYHLKESKKLNKLNQERVGALVLAKTTGFRGTTDKEIRKFARVVGRMKIHADNEIAHLISEQLDLDLEEVLTSQYVLNWAKLTIIFRQ